MSLETWDAHIRTAAPLWALPWSRAPTCCITWIIPQSMFPSVWRYSGIVDTAEEFLASGNISRRNPTAVTPCCLRLQLSAKNPDSTIHAQHKQLLSNLWCSTNSYHYILPSPYTFHLWNKFTAKETLCSTPTCMLPPRSHLLLISQSLLHPQWRLPFNPPKESIHAVSSIKEGSTGRMSKCTLSTVSPKRMSLPSTYLGNLFLPTKRFSNVCHPPYDKDNWLDNS